MNDDAPPGDPQPHSDPPAGALPTTRARPIWSIWLWLLPLALVTGLWAIPRLFGSGARSQPEPSDEASEPASLTLRPAEIATVEVRRLPTTLRASGTLQPLASGRANLTAEVPGKLTQFHLRPGDPVTSGQLLGRILRDDLRATAAEKEAGVAEAKRALAALEAKLPLERRSLAAQAESARAAMRMAQARLSLMRAGNRPEEIEQSEAQLAGAKADLERLRTGALPLERRQSEATVREMRAEVEVSTKAAERMTRLVERGIAAVKERERAEADLARARERLATAEAALALLLEGTRSELIHAQEAKVRELSALVNLQRQGFPAAEIQEAEAGVDAARAKLDEVEAARGQFPVLDREVDAARERLHQAEFAARAARALQSQTLLRAPITGVTGAVTVADGEVIQLGQPLAVLESEATLRLLLQVPAASQSQLRPGLPVTITSPHQPGLRVAGTIRAISPDANPETGTLTAEVWLPNQTRHLRAGLVVSGEVRLRKPLEATVIPAGSVFALNGEQYVWVLDGEHKVHQSPVTLGMEQADTVQVLKGLRPGQQIIRDGSRSIAEGTEITLGPGE